jgi:hypothetical protein
MSKNYVVDVQTGDLEGGGTDADVYVQLIGEKNTSSMLTLDNEGDDFIQGELNRFNLNSEDVGWIDQVRVLHRNNGRYPGWFLEYVNIIDPAAGLSWRADFHRWLATDEDDGSIDVTRDIPISSVTLGQGSIKKVCLGIVCKQFNNSGSNDCMYHYNFVYAFKRGCSTDLSNSQSVSMGIQLGASFFGTDAKFSAEVTKSISTTLGSSEEETSEWTTEFEYNVPAGKAITVAAVYYQTVLEGIADASNVRFGFSQKFNITDSIYIFDGLLSDAEVEQRIIWLIMMSLGRELRKPLRLNDQGVVLLDEKLPQINPDITKQARERLDKPIIEEHHLQDYPGVSIYKQVKKPLIRKIENARRVSYRIP